MGISIPGSVFVFALLAGCSSSVQVGLANAPVLGGATPETRVHDVVANGRDACERSAFAQGEVLRGRTPSCASKEGVARVLRFHSTAPPAAGVSPGYSLGVCPGAAPGLTRAELGLVAVSLYSPQGLVCHDIW